MADDKDPPIQPQNFLGGVTVVNIGDVRVARGLSRRHHSSCPHGNMVYDKKERRIWCQDCEKDIEGFDAFSIIIEWHSAVAKDLQRRQTAMDEVEKFKMRSIAAKKMDEACRSLKMVPCCPHCHNGLFPEDFKSGISMLGKDYAEARKRGKI